MHQIEHFPRLALDVVLRLLFHFQAESDVLFHRHIGEQCVTLEYGVDRTLVWRHLVDALVAQVDFAGIQGFQTADGPQQCRLAATGGAEQHEEFAGFDVQAHVVDGVDQFAFRRPEGLAGAVDGQAAFSQFHVLVTADTDAGIIRLMRLGRR